MSIGVGDALGTFKKQALIFLVAAVGFTLGYWINATFYNEYSPVQPIAFSHKIHATDNQIPCMYCHAYADHTNSAGVPPVSRCMGCHKVVKTDSPEIQKVAGYWNRNEPIPWIKVHDVPDFVYFPHKRHISAGLACQTCHGPIETEERVVRQASLLMPWCVDCHTTKEVVNGKDCWTCHK